MPAPLKTALSLLAVALLAASCRVAPQNGVRLGETIPEFELPALDGGRISSRSYLGSPVVLNFWATWCKPCVKEIPTLNAIARENAAQVVTIAIDEEGESAVRPFVERHGVSYTVLLGDKEIFQRFGGWAIPYTLVLDPSLRVVGLHRGYVSLRSLERDLRRAES